MKPCSIIVIVLACLMCYCYSAVVIDLAGKFNNFTCFQNSGYSHVIVRSYHSYGAIDLDANDNILQANAAGLSTDTYMFPCRGKDPSTQVKDLLEYLNSMKSGESAFAYQSGTIWLDIETNPSTGCSWSLGNFDTNCQFIRIIVDELQARGRSVGIYASHYMWLQILGAVDRCNLFMDLPLWYAHYDNKMDFSDWPTNQFGGWSEPTMKQFAGDSPVCGLKVDLSYY